MIIPSYYQQLASGQNLQFLIDNSQTLLDSQSIWRNWLTAGVPQMSLQFDSVIGRDRIAAAASIVDSDAPAPLRSRNKIERYSGKIPAIKEKFRMNQDDMRAIEVIRALPIVTGGGSTALIDFLNKDLQEAAVSGDKRVDFMFLQALSTFTVDVNATNNPDGAVYGVIDLLAQSYQSQGVPVVWTDKANATPIDDIENYIEFQSNNRGRLFGQIIMSYDQWLVFKQTTQVKNYLQSFFNTGKANASYAVTLSNVNEFMDANGWPQITIINYTTQVEVDGKPTFLKGFKKENVVFAPAGKLGILYNAISMEKIHPVVGKNYANYGATLVAKWAENDPLVEFTGMELNAFPGLNIDGVFNLKTDTVQANFI